MEVSSHIYSTVLVALPLGESMQATFRGGWMVSRAGHEKLERDLLPLPAVYTVFSVVQSVARSLNLLQSNRY